MGTPKMAGYLDVLLLHTALYSLTKDFALLPVACHSLSKSACVRAGFNTSVHGVPFHLNLTLLNYAFITGSRELRLVHLDQKEEEVDAERVL